MIRNRPRVHTQSEIAECGLACMAMIASHHGFETNLLELRRQFPLSLKGTKLTQLMHIARRLGFQARALQLDLEGLPQLRLPCVLHWDLNHFVVLSKVGRDKVTVLDPARGEREMPLSELSAHFTGVALEVLPGTDFRTRPALPAVSVRQLTGEVSQGNRVNKLP